MGSGAVKMIQVYAPFVDMADSEDYNRLQGVGWRAGLGIGCTWAADVANAGENNVILVSGTAL